MEFDGDSDRLFPANGNPACLECMKKGGFESPPAGQANQKVMDEAKATEDADEARENATASEVHGFPGPTGDPGKPGHSPKPHGGPPPMALIGLSFLVNAIISALLFSSFKAKLQQRKEGREESTSFLGGEAIQDDEASEKAAEEGVAEQEEVAN